MPITESNSDDDDGKLEEAHIWRPGQPYPVWPCKLLDQSHRWICGPLMCKRAFYRRQPRNTNTNTNTHINTNTNTNKNTNRHINTNTYTNTNTKIQLHNKYGQFQSHRWIRSLLMFKRAFYRRHTKQKQTNMFLLKVKIQSIQKLWKWIRSLM